MTYAGTVLYGFRNQTDVKAEFYLELAEIVDASTTNG